MYNIVYKITNIIDGKIYIGIHKTKDINDGYMGSGKLIKRAIEKHGVENFIKEIIFQSDDYEECRLFEKKIVNEDFCKDAQTYNISIGGTGGNVRAGMTANEIEEYNRKLSVENASRYCDSKYAERHRQISSKSWENEETRRLRTENIRKSMLEFHANKTIEDYDTLRLAIEKSWKDSITRENRLAAMRTDEYREKQRNKIFITNGVENRKLDKSEPIPDGWRKGMVKRKSK